MTKLGFNFNNDDEFMPIGVEDIDPQAKIFTGDHIYYLDVLVGQHLLQGLKGQILNVIEGIGLPEKQEIAVKRLITNFLHETRREFVDDLELVKINEEQ